MGRQSYEFSEHTKEAARLRWHKDNPKRQSEELEVDHIIAIWWMRENGIPPVVGRSAQNARALPTQEHIQKHRDETSEEYRLLAVFLTGFVGSLV